MLHNAQELTAQQLRVTDVSFRQMARTLYATLALVCVLPLVGCYSLMGVEHNYVAVRDLEPGITLAECIEDLAAGGSVEVKWDLPIDTLEERESAIEGENVLVALTDAESTEGHAVRALYLVRRWGFMGLGEIHLFLDAQDDLVGYHLYHIN